jgi:iron complex outermembrane recepter protein
LRYVHSFGKRFAIKLATSGLYAHDWLAQDEGLVQYNSDENENFLQNGTDRVNVYGDELYSDFAYNGQVIRVARTGFRESEFLDNRRSLFKLNWGLYYNVGKDMRLTYEGRFHQGDFIMRIVSPIVGRGYQLQNHKLEFKGRDFFVRAYHSSENSNRSYTALDAAIGVQFYTMSTPDWVADYGQAFRGEIQGVAAESEAAARAYADRTRIVRGDEGFAQLFDSTTRQSDLIAAGSLFVSESSMTHAEGQYDFTDLLGGLFSAQVGGSYRFYQLISNGKFYNDGALGFNAPIPIQNSAAYVQVSKQMFKERWRLLASLRADQHQYFQTRLTPRIATVISLGQNKAHNIRASYQTGFRNPSSAELFGYLVRGNGASVGTLEENINNFNVIYQNSTLPANPYNRAGFGVALPILNGDTVSGVQIFNNLTSVQSLLDINRHLQNNRLGSALIYLRDSLEYLNLDYLRQEQIATYEIGYKGLINEKLFIDIGGYYNIYTDFILQAYTFSPDLLKLMLVNTNATEQITSYGFNAELDYLFPLNYRVNLGYSHNAIDDSGITNRENKIIAFNTPRHLFQASVSNTNVYKNIGFSLHYRAWTAYEWQTAFTFGQIPSAHVLDVAINYQLPKQSITLQLGGTNLLGSPYTQALGSASIGSQVFFSLRYTPVAADNQYNP